MVDPQRTESSIHETATEARAGTTPRDARYVLIFPIAEFSLFKG